VQNNTLGLISLAKEGNIGVLKSGEFFLVSLTLTLQLFCNLLL
jgi:hypothetical protein